MEAILKRADISCKQRQILVIEKSILARQLITNVLSRAGHMVIAAEDVNDALCRLNELKPDLVLIDANISVIEFLAQLRDNPNCRFIPVALLVDKSEESRNKGRTAGINQWIEKPFTQATLLDGIKKFI